MFMRMRLSKNGSWIEVIRLLRRMTLIVYILNQLKTGLLEIVYILLL